MNALFSVFRRLFALSVGAFQDGRPHRSWNDRRCQPAVERLDERVLPSITPVGPTAGAPFHAVVEVEATFPDHQTVVGSGAMIDSSHVLTTAHLLYSAKDGGYATSVEAIPDLNGSRAPFGVAFGTYERVDASWLKFSAANPGTTSPAVADIGLVTLNRAIGNSTGWFTLGYNNNNAFFKSTTFETAGYPAGDGYSGRQMFVSAGRALGAVSNVGIGFLQSSITVSSGQSGSPLWQPATKGSPVLYGVISGATGLTASKEAYAARITQAVYNELKTWEKADKTPPAGSSVTSASQVKLQHPAVTAAQLKGAVSSASHIYALDDYTYYEPGIESDWVDPIGLFYNAYTGGSNIPWTTLANSAYQYVYQYVYQGMYNTFSSVFGGWNDPATSMFYADPYGDYGY